MNFRVVDHEHASKLDHCTISRKGVTRMRADDETEFIPLDRWEQEFMYFQQLVEVSGPRLKYIQNMLFFIKIKILRPEENNIYSETCH